MAYQFVHVNTVSKKNGARMSGEADRAPGNAPHVERPAPPVKIRGTCATVRDAWDVIQARAEATKVAVECKDGVTRYRSQRADAGIGLAAVASFHVPTAEARKNPAQLKAWIRQTLDHIEKEHGPALCAVLHTDERYPHIHAWFAPPEGQTLSASGIHPGITARDAAAKSQPTRTAKSGGEARNRGGREYVKAMREYQDRYHQAVAVRFGEARLGPGRQRLSRAEWHAQQAAQLATAEAIQRQTQITTAAQQAAQQAIEKATKAETDAKAAISAKDSREHVIKHQNGRISQLKCALDDVSERRNNLIDAVLDAQDVDDLRVIQDELRASSSTQNTAHAPSLSPTQK